MNPLTGLFSPATRKAMYVVFALAGLAVGAVMAWCGATDQAQPDWVDGATAVLTYVGAGLGLTAASNVPTPDTDEPGGQPEGDVRGAIDLGTALLVAVLLLVLLALLGVIG